MASHLVDTDVLIDVSRGSREAASYVDSLGDPTISIITAQELIAGARDKRDLGAIDSLVASYSIEHLDAAIGLRAYDLLKKYAKSDGLRPLDSLIAATAIERDLVLATRNRKHFAMIDGLRLDVPRF